MNKLTFSLLCTLLKLFHLQIAGAQSGMEINTDGPQNQLIPTNQINIVAGSDEESSWFGTKSHEKTTQETQKTSSFSIGVHLIAIDFVVVAVYLLIILAAGLHCLHRKDQMKSSGYFYPGREVTWFVIGIPLFSSSLTAASFIGLAGMGSSSGIAVGVYEWMAIPVLLILGWFFLPAYLQAGAPSLPLYMKKRFGRKRIKIYVSVIMLAVNIFIKIAADLYAGTLFIKYAFGWDAEIAVIFILILTALYVGAGGLYSGIFSGVLQFFAYMFGMVAMTITIFNRVGDLNYLENIYKNATSDHQLPTNSCGDIKSDFFHIFRHPSSDKIPAPGIIIGFVIVNLYYFCADRPVFEKILAAKSVLHAKGASIFAGLLKILPMFMLVMVGMIGRFQYSEYITCSSKDDCDHICGNPAGCSNVIYPLLLVEQMPKGFKGLLFAAILVALMISIGSALMNSSKLFTNNLWRKSASNTEQWIVSKVFLALIAIIAVFWRPIVKESYEGQLFAYVVSFTGYLTAPIVVVLIQSVLCTRLTEKGAFWSLLCGSVIGIIRLILTLVYRVPYCGEAESRPAIVHKNQCLMTTTIMNAGLFIIYLTTLCYQYLRDVTAVIVPVHYLHAIMLLAGITALLSIIISLLWPEPQKRSQVLIQRTDEIEVSEAVQLQPFHDVEGEGKVEEDDDDDKDDCRSRKASGKKGSDAAKLPADFKALRHNCIQRWMVMVCGYNNCQYEDSCLQTPIMDREESKSLRYLVNMFCATNVIVTVVLLAYYH